jgi:hypothetical protein
MEAAIPTHTSLKWDVCLGERSHIVLWFLQDAHSSLLIWLFLFLWPVKTGLTVSSETSSVNSLRISCKNPKTRKKVFISPWKLKIKITFFDRFICSERALGRHWVECWWSPVGMKTMEKRKISAPAGNITSVSRSSSPYSSCNADERSWLFLTYGKWTDVQGAGETGTLTFQDWLQCPHFITDNRTLSLSAFYK